MENERLEILKRKANHIIMVDVLRKLIISSLFLLVGMALAIESGISYVVIPFLIIFLYFLWVSLYYAILFKKKNKSVKP